MPAYVDDVIQQLQRVKDVIFASIESEQNYEKKPFTGWINNGTGNQFKAVVEAFSQGLSQINYDKNQLRIALLGQRGKSGLLQDKTLKIKAFLNGNDNVLEFFAANLDSLSEVNAAWVAHQKGEWQPAAAQNPSDDNYANLPPAPPPPAEEIDEVPAEAEAKQEKSPPTPPRQSKKPQRKIVQVGDGQFDEQDNDDVIEAPDMFVDEDALDHVAPHEPSPDEKPQVVAKPVCPPLPSRKKTPQVDAESECPPLPSPDEKPQADAESERPPLPSRDKKPQVIAKPERPPLPSRKKKPQDGTGLVRQPSAFFQSGNDKVDVMPELGPEPSPAEQHNDLLKTAITTAEQKYNALSFFWKRHKAESEAGIKTLKGAGVEDLPDKILEVIDQHGQEWTKGCDFASILLEELNTTLELDAANAVEKPNTNRGTFVDAFREKFNIKDKAVLNPL